MSKEVGLSIEFIPDKPWDWSGISQNQNLTMEYITNNFLDCDGISQNYFNYKKRDGAARIIQKGCHDWLYKPILNDGKFGIVKRLGMRNLNI
jgi:hypothetical protein